MSGFFALRRLDFLPVKPAIRQFPRISLILFVKFSCRIVQIISLFGAQSGQAQ
jgi:hypothetical protein